MFFIAFQALNMQKQCWIWAFIFLGGAVTFKMQKPVEVENMYLTGFVKLTARIWLRYHRGKRNHSGYLHEIIQKISEIRNTDFDVIAEATALNADKLFGLEL